MNKLYIKFSYLLLVLLGVSLQLSADNSGYFDIGAFDLYFSYQRPENTSDYHHKYICSESSDVNNQGSGCNSTGVGVKDLGVVISLYIDRFYANVWKDNGGNVCSVDLHYSKDKFKSSHGYKNYCGVKELNSNSTNQEFYWNSKTSGKSDERLSDDGGINMIDFVTSSNRPGNYNINFYFAGKFSNDATCPEKTNKDLNNGSSTYQFSFTIPGFDGEASMDFGDVSAADNKKKLTYTFGKYGLKEEITATLSAGSRYSFEANSDVKTKTFTGSSVDIYFTPEQDVSSNPQVGTLTLTSKYNESINYDKSVDLTGNFVNSHPVTVLIADVPTVIDGPRVTLQGYLKYAHCQSDLTKAGFFYAEGTDCNSVTSSSASKEVSTGKVVRVGDTFSGSIISGLKTNTTYSYKAYVEDTKGVKYLSADCGTFTTQGACKYPKGDTIYYTIDQSLLEDDPCNLSFVGFENAIADLKKHDDPTSDNYWWNSSNSMLQRNIVFQVASGKYGKDISNWVDFSGINRYSSTSDDVPSKYLIIRPSVSGTTPIIYGMNLERSRWITVKNIKIQRNNTGKGLTCSAILLGLNDTYNANPVGVIKSSNISFISCDIEGQNFCSIHAHGIDGLYMENCNLTAVADETTSDDTFNWGASIKFMNCKNIKLINNNFRGSHANNIFAQNVQNMLVMNNVFWNDHTAVRKDNTWNYLAFIRLLNYGASDNDHKVKNIGMYYNTFFLKAKDGNTSKVDFLTLGGKQQGQNKTYYETSTIEFKYNNCYSYDAVVNGKSAAPDSFCDEKIVAEKNNFWSEYDEQHIESDGLTKSVFAFGDSYFINIPQIVCKTAPYTPEGLIIRGDALNKGVKISSDISGQGGELITNDRLYHSRPSVWTLGAYQQKIASGTVSTIIWTGNEDSRWDNRNNWIKEDGTQLDCVDILSENVQVIIPDLNKSKAVTGTNYPIIPVWEAPDPNNEPVRAGMGVIDVPSVTKFASSIVVEYGGSVRGVENLTSDGKRRYDSAKTTLTVQRRNATNSADEWVLVGTIVKPFVSGSTTEVRPIQSGDYYIANHEPHVYMQHVKVEDGKISNGTTFTSLEQVVALQSAYMIKVPDQYGNYKIPAADYYKYLCPDPSKVGDGSVAKSFNFVGWYAAENELPSFNVEGASVFNFVNNYYPANLNVSKLLSDNNGLYAKMYDYEHQQWVDVQDDEDSEIKPQNGFVLYKASAATISTSGEDYTQGNTRYRSALAKDKIKLSAINLSDNATSTIYIKTETDNLPKAFGTNPTTPELFIPYDGKNYSTFKVENSEQVVPLSVRNSSTEKFSLQFKVESYFGFDDIILEDRLNSKEYDLTDVSPIFHNVSKGEISNRFFLRVSTSITTDVPSYKADENSNGANNLITVTADGMKIQATASSELTMQKIYVTDMSGKTMEYKPNGSNFTQHTLPVARGVYMVRVVADQAEHTQKVILE